MPSSASCVPLNASPHYEALIVRSTRKQKAKTEVYSRLQFVDFAEAVVDAGLRTDYSCGNPVYQGMENRPFATAMVRPLTNTKSGDVRPRTENPART